MRPKTIIPLLLMLLSILFINTAAIAQGEITIEGTIREINIFDRGITLWDYNDKLHRLQVDSSIDMNEIYFEQEASVTIRGNKAIRITPIPSTDPELDGYIIPGSRFRTGTVLFINNDEIQIQTINGREKFQIDPMYTTIYRKNQRIELFQIKEGDRVLLSFDDIYSSIVGEIKVKDAEKHIGGIIKGKIQLVDERNKEILLSEPRELKQGQWVPSTKFNQRIKLGTGSIYEGGKAITIGSLSKRKGEEAYIAYDNAYGTVNITKMLLKSGSSMEYKNRIQNIDYGTGQMVVDTNSFMLHEGTIVIKDNRLVDPLNLNINQNVYLVSDFRYGSRGASVITIEDSGIIDDRIDGTRLWIYKGKIEDIFDYSLTLGRYNYRMDKQALTSSGFKPSPKPEEFTLTLDTLVYDSQLEKVIPTNSFLDSRYIDLMDIKDKSLRDRIAKGYYKNKPAYLIVKETVYGKEALAINLMPQGLNDYSQTTTLDYSILGEIGSIGTDGHTLTINNARTHNNLNNRWDYGKDEVLNLNKAIVLVDDKPLSIEEIYKLKQGSRAYIVKHNESATDVPYIIIVESN